MLEITPNQPAYPTSNKKKKDWNSIDKEIEADLKNEKPEGDQALNKLFKEIYDRADDDTRRAMNKSFQTSGGTVLSTNWGEVAKSDYEGKDRPTAPQVARCSRRIGARWPNLITRARTDQRHLRGRSGGIGQRKKSSVYTTRCWAWGG